MAQVISKYLKPLSRNEYTIGDTQVFSKHIKDLPPLQEDEEDVSYDVESMFTNILINETIEYILDQIYSKKRLKLICSKLIFKRLLTKLATEVTFTINKNVFKQIDGSQQTFVLMKTSFIFFFKRRLQEYILINHTSSEDVFKTSWSRPIYSSCPYVFKASSRRFQDVFKTSCHNVFKRFSRRLQDVLRKRLQDVFKKSSRRFQDVFKTSSRRLANTS